MCFPRLLPTARQLQGNSSRDLLSLLWCVIRVVVSYLLVSYSVMNFLTRIFSVCHSFRSMCQSGRMKGFERCFKVEHQGTWRRQNLHAAILRPPAKRLQTKLYEPIWGKKSPLWEILSLFWGKKSPLWEILSPFWG